MLSPLALALHLALAQAGTAPLPRIQAREHRVERDGRTISVLEKSLAGFVRPGPRRVAIVLPSASYSSRAVFDLQVRDYSVMDALARDGWDVFAVDFLGYGKSDPPFEGGDSNAADAVKDLAAATSYIHALTGVERSDVIGWSWGSQVAGRYAQLHPDRVSGLVLYGFTHEMLIPEEAFPEGLLEERTRPVTPESIRADFVPGAHDPDLPEAFADACLRLGNRAPNGSLRDYVYGLPVVDPGRLKAPTLMIYGEHEFEGNDPFFQARRRDAEGFFERLDVPRKALSVLPGGGHAVHLEKPHREWQSQVTTFLRGARDERATGR